MDYRAASIEQPLRLWELGFERAVCLYCGNSSYPDSVQGGTLLRHPSGFYLHYCCVDRMVDSIPPDFQPEVLVALLNRGFLCKEVERIEEVREEKGESK